MTTRLLRLAPILLLLVISLTATSSRAQNCFTMSDSVINLGDVMIDGVVYFDVSFTSVQGTKNDIVVRYETQDTFTFQHLLLITPSDTIRAYSDTPTVATLRLDSFLLGDRNYTIFFEAGQGCVDTLTVRARGIDTTAVQLLIPLSPGTPQSYAFNTTEQSTDRTIVLHNTTGAVITIDSILPYDPKVITGLKHIPPPVDVKPDGLFSISFTFVADSVGYHRSGVRLPNNTGLASEYSIQVIRHETGIGSVPPLLTSSGIRVSQYTSELSIEGLSFDRGELAIYDLLGRRVRSHEIESREFIIAKRDDNGLPIADGCYILHIRDEHGRVSESFKVLLLSY